MQNWGEYIQKAYFDVQAKIQALKDCPDDQVAKCTNDCVKAFKKLSNEYGHIRDCIEDGGQLNKLKTDYDSKLKPLEEDYNNTVNSRKC